MSNWNRLMELRRRFVSPDDPFGRYFVRGLLFALVSSLLLSAVATALGAEVVATALRGIAILAGGGLALVAAISITASDLRQIAFSWAVLFGLTLYPLGAMMVASEVDGVLGAFMLLAGIAVLVVRFMERNVIRLVQVCGAALCGILLLFPPWSAHADLGPRQIQIDVEQGRGLFTAAPELDGDCIERGPMMMIPGPRGFRSRSFPCLKRGDTVQQVPIAFYRSRVNVVRLCLELLIVAVFIAGLTMWNSHIRQAGAS